MNKICSFSGHRKIEYNEQKRLYKALLEVISILAEEGFTEFRVGGALGFDTLSADAVLEVKKKHPQIDLVMYIPCLDQNKFYSPEQNKRYLTHINAASKRLCMSEKYYNGCMQMRNREMIKGADCLVSYLRKDSGGTAFTVARARENGLNIIEL